MDDCDIQQTAIRHPRFTNGQQHCWCKRHSWFYYWGSPEFVEKMVRNHERYHETYDPGQTA